MAQAQLPQNMTPPPERKGGQLPATMDRGQDNSQQQQRLFSGASPLDDEDYAGGDWSSVLAGFKLKGDAFFAVGFLAIIAILILPMPTWLLDLCLAFSIGFSVLILITTLLIPKPTEFSSFPTILLVATLIRLALNVASTRLILSNGHTGVGAAGEVIRAFGSFIMSGNFVIGVIVFIILVLINFVVITKGSGRIAEVSARFTLDAMPGKQMAIDADLSSGLIDENEARRRRKELENESSFFGSMDGAAKFVRGDAVAGIIITAINVIGGIIIGVLQNGMTVLDATKTYTYLTVGDGLVSQIPALIVSIGAGMLVTKGAASEGTGNAMAGQLSNYPIALMMSGFILLFLGILPGIPFIPFTALATMCCLGAWFTLEKSQKNAEASRQEGLEKIRAQQYAAEPQEETVESALKIDDIRLELGFGLLPLLRGDAMGGRALSEQIKTIRRQLATEMGFLMPSVRITDNLGSSSTFYRFYIKESLVGEGDLRPHLLLCMNPAGTSIDTPGEETIEPTFQLPARWITPDNKDAAEKMGYTVVTPSTVIVTHMTEIVKESMADLLSIEQLQKLISELSEGYKKMVQDAIPSQLSYATLQRILQNLLRERVSIRDFPGILEGIFEIVGTSRSLTTMTEHVRTRLSRQLCQAAASSNGTMELVLLTPEWERAFQDAIVGDADSRQLAMAPSQLQQFVERLKDVVEGLIAQGHEPVILTSSSIRPFVRAIVERTKPLIMVLSQNEVHPKAKLSTIGQI